MSKLPRLEADQSERGLIQGPAGNLEFRLEMPAGSPRGVALICHPHPLHGGTMDNKVVYALSRAALASGCIAMRFQFRGVGGSDGPHDHGVGETEDTAFLFERLRELQPELPAFLMGFSFGSFMALKVASGQDAAGLVAIAPPLAYAADAPVPEPRCPWLLVHGTADDVVPFEQTRARSDGMRNQPQIVTVDDVGHFFHGKLSVLREAVEPWLAERMKAN